MNLNQRELLIAEEVRERLKLKSLQATYDFLRRNRDLCVLLGERQIRVDAAKLDAFIARGGVEVKTQSGDV